MDKHKETTETRGTDHINQTAAIVCAYVANNRVPALELATLIATTHAALTGLSAVSVEATPSVEKLTPARIRRSITHEALISFEDGRPYKTLKRHLAKLGLSPEAYREKWVTGADIRAVAFCGLAVT